VHAHNCFRAKRALIGDHLKIVLETGRVAGRLASGVPRQSLWRRFHF